MATLSFYARGDGSSANNPSLNVDNLRQQETVLITFDSGPTGNLVLESNGGQPDPDTTVIINGISYAFTVELIGDLPVGENKVPDPLEGKQIAIISVNIGGSIERFFFVTDGSGTPELMDKFGNGAIALTNTVNNPPEVFVCFGSGTEIATPTGNKRIETLQVGDLVMTRDHGPKPIYWINSSSQPLEDTDSDDKPVLLKAASLGQNLPARDLIVSPQHRILVGGAGQLQGIFDREAFAPAKSLTALPGIRHMMGRKSVTWIHFACERHEVVCANGCWSESLLLGHMAMQALSETQRAALHELFSAEAEITATSVALNGPSARPCLKVGEARRMIAQHSQLVRLHA